MYWERWSSKCFSGATDNARPGASLPSQSVVRKSEILSRVSCLLLIAESVQAMEGWKIEKYEKKYWWPLF